MLNRTKMYNRDRLWKKNTGQSLNFAAITVGRPSLE